MEGPDKKKHLPVLKNAETEEIPGQSPWVWVLFGGIVVVSVWVPLAMVALFLGRRLAVTSGMGLSGLVLFSFACACVVGGAVVGRFANHPRRLDAGLAGALGCLFVLVLAAIGNALRPPTSGAAIALSLLVVGLPTAALGGRLGRKHRS